MAKKAAALKAKAEEVKTAEVETETTAQPAAATNDEVTILDELIDVAKVKQANFPSQGAKENDRAFFLRLVSVVAEVDDATFESLPERAQTWFNAAVNALKEDKAPEAPAGFVSKFGAAKEPGKPGRPKAEKAAAAPKEPRAPGVVQLGRTLLIENTGYSLEEFTTAAKAAKWTDKEGKPLDLKESTLAAVYTDTLSTIKLVKALGFWKDAA